MLAKCRRDAGDVRSAFATYQHLRRARVERVVRYSARIGRTKSPAPIGRWFRDLCLPAALKVFARPTAHACLYRYHIDWSERVATLAGEVSS